MGVHLVTIRSPWYNYPSLERLLLLIVMLTFDLYVILCNIFYFLFCFLILLFYVVKTVEDLRRLKSRTKILKFSMRLQLLKSIVGRYIEIQVLHTYFNGIFGRESLAYILLVTLANHCITLYAVLKLCHTFPIISVIAIVQYALVAFPLMELIFLLQLGQVFELSKGLVREWNGMLMVSRSGSRKSAGLRAISFKCLARFTKVTGLKFILVVCNITKNVILAF